MQRGARGRRDAREQRDVCFLKGARKEKDTERKEGKSTGDGTEEDIKDRLELKKKRKSWIEEDWYREVVWFKSYELTKKEKGSHQLANRIRRKAANFRLTARENGSASLAFFERNGSWSWCVRPNQIQSVLSHYHDNHGHFSTTITQRRFIRA